MPQYLQCDTKTLRLILDKTKRYYSITQNELNCSSSISRKHISISEETGAELTCKMLGVNEEIKSFVTYLSDDILSLKIASSAFSLSKHHINIPGSLSL